MSAALRKAFKKVGNAEKELARVLTRDYPLNTKISWERNGTHYGTVIMHGADRLKVYNTRSGKQYWIHAYCIVDSKGMVGL